MSNKYKHEHEVPTDVIEVSNYPITCPLCEAILNQNLECDAPNCIYEDVKEFITERDMPNTVELINGLYKNHGKATLVMMLIDLMDANKKSIDYEQEHELQIEQLAELKQQLAHSQAVSKFLAKECVSMDWTIQSELSTKPDPKDEQWWLEHAESEVKKESSDA